MMVFGVNYFLFKFILAWCVLQLQIQNPHVFTQTSSSGTVFEYHFFCLVDSSETQRNFLNQSVPSCLMSQFFSFIYERQIMFTPIPLNMTSLHSVTGHLFSMDESRSKCFLGLLREAGALDLRSHSHRLVLTILTIDTILSSLFIQETLQQSSGYEWSLTFRPFWCCR